MVGVLKDGSINAIKIVNEGETPGIGSQVRQEPFCGRFKNKKMADIGQVQAITGATISSRAVINSVTKKLKEVLAQVQDGK